MAAPRLRILRREQCLEGRPRNHLVYPGEELRVTGGTPHLREDRSQKHVLLGQPQAPTTGEGRVPILQFFTPDALLDQSLPKVTYRTFTFEAVIPLAADALPPRLIEPAMLPTQLVASAQ